MRESSSGSVRENAGESVDPARLSRAELGEETRADADEALLLLEAVGYVDGQVAPVLEAALDLGKRRIQRVEVGRLEGVELPDALARATYAVYNGGPSHRRRYRLENTKKSLRSIDRSFYEKYLTIKSGDSKALIGCYLG